MIMEKFNKLVDRLTNKVRMSATPVKGFVLGISGTDSIITYILLNEVAKTEKFNIFCIHYIEPFSKPDKPQRHMIEWLEKNYPEFYIDVLLPPGGNLDQYRWGDLHANAIAREYWTVSTMNATEKILGNYSIMTKSASIAPITSLYKSEILQLCKEFKVPEEIIKQSRLPDCLCGRDEFAAENIELIDDILRNNLSRIYSRDMIYRGMEYIRDQKRDNGFKNRTPYEV